MRGLLYLITLVLLVGWVLGFFVYQSSGIIHALLVLALISLVTGLVRRA
jgi:Family of unknown function (DUF5670)